MYVFSSEVRWFFPGVIGTDHGLLTWFKKPLTGYGRNPEELWVLEADDPANPRVDEYLVLPGTTTVGTKLRGGDKDTGLDVKAQAAAPASWRIDDRLRGRVDSWTKWSFKHATLTPALEPMRQGGKWIRIGKDRWLRKISADGAKPAFVVPNAKAYKKDNPDAALRRLPDSGCNFELTQIFVDNNRQDPKKAWFTICFEAFAPEMARTRTVLDSCARLALDELGLPPDADLDERTSLSYTGWFGTLEGR